MVGNIRFQSDREVSTSISEVYIRLLTSFYRFMYVSVSSI